MKIEDLGFKAPFVLTAAHNDYIHSIAMYFNVEFSRCHKPILLSTSPFKTGTHWKQVSFYLKSVIAIKRGESIYGSISIKKNSINSREIDIIISINFEGALMKVEETNRFIIV